MGMGGRRMNGRMIIRLYRRERIDSWFRRNDKGKELESALGARGGKKNPLLSQGAGLGLGKQKAWGGWRNPLLS